MHVTPTSLRLDLRIHHEPAGAWGVRERLFLEERRDHPVDRLLLELSAFALLYDPNLTPGAAVSDRDRPALADIGLDGAPRRIVDCGELEPRRILHLARRFPEARLDLVFPDAAALSAAKAALASTIVRPERVGWWAFRDGFVGDLRELLASALAGGRQKVEVTVTGRFEHLFVLSNQDVVESPILAAA